LITLFSGEYNETAARGCALVLGRLPDLARQRRKIAGESMTEWIQKIRAIYERADLRSGGWLSVMRQSGEHFVEMRASEAAASLAYYGLFALFPLTLFLVGIMGYVFERQAAYTQALFFLQSVLPFSAGIIDDALREVIERRSAFGLFGLIGLMWAASTFFNILVNHINRAWPSVKLRGVVQSRLVAIAIIGVLVALLALSLLSTTLLRLLPVVVRALGGDLSVIDASGLRPLLGLVPALFTFLFFMGLYRWVPNKVVTWRSVLTGAAVVTVVWELAKHVFSLFLSSGLARFYIVYGPLESLIALMIWIYVSNLIVLLGAHFVAALDQRAEQRQKLPVFEPEIETPTKGVRG